MYNKDLDKVLADEEGGDLGRIFRSIANGRRPANTSSGVDNDLAKKEAQELYNVHKKYNKIYLIYSFFFFFNFQI